MTRHATSIQIGKKVFWYKKLPLSSGKFYYLKAVIIESIEVNFHAVVSFETTCENLTTLLLTTEVKSPSLLGSCGNECYLWWASYRKFNQKLPVWWWTENPSMLGKPCKKTNPSCKEIISNVTIVHKMRAGSSTSFCHRSPPSLMAFPKGVILVKLKAIPLLKLSLPHIQYIKAVWYI